MSSNFIEEYENSISDEQCKNLITLFEINTDLHHSGCTTLGYNPDSKKDTEISIDNALISERPEWSNAFSPVLDALKDNVEKYKEKYESLDGLDKWAMQPPAINFQRFLPGEGYKAWHCETPDKISAKRILVWMLYLNTVTDAGGTEFYNQNYTCKSQSGKMVIWPPYWTHFHRSQVSPTQVKYIMTGWFSYV
jgi:hypothetical protein